MKSLDNFSEAYTKLNEIFKFDDESKSGVSGLFGSLTDAASSMLNKGKSFNQMGIILTSVHVMSMVKDGLEKWSEFDKNSIKNFEFALVKLKNTIPLMGDVDFDDTENNINQLGKIMTSYLSTVDKVTKLEKEINMFNSLMDVVKISLDKWNGENYEIASKSITSSLGELFNRVEKPGNKYKKNVDTTIRLFDKLKTLKDLQSSAISEPFDKIINRVNRLELKKADALTNMFNSFSKIREKNIFSNFKDSVDEFTKACIQLVEAINGNTDALNNDDLTSQDNNSNNSNTSTPTTNTNKGTDVRITNLDELAQMLAQKIAATRVGQGGSPSGGIATVDLRINGQGGNQWVIKKY